jgi:hypothetical protein
LQIACFRAYLVTMLKVVLLSFFSSIAQMNACIIAEQSLVRTLPSPETNKQTNKQTDRHACFRAYLIIILKT